LHHPCSIGQTKDATAIAAIDGEADHIAANTSVIGSMQQHLLKCGEVLYKFCCIIFLLSGEYCINVPKSSIHASFQFIKTVNRRLIIATKSIAYRFRVYFVKHLHITGSMD